MISLSAVSTSGRASVTTLTDAELERLTRLLGIVTARGDRATALILKGRIDAIRQGEHDRQPAGRAA
jgi:hypothetical protein